MSDVLAALRRHRVLAAALLVPIPIVMLVYLAARDVVRPPARYTTSADILIPARDAKTGNSPTDVPPVLLQGQTALALSRTTTDFALKASRLDLADDNKVSFSADLSEGASIMTLAVSAPKPETAATVLRQYIDAFQKARRQAVVDASVELQAIETHVIEILTVRLNNIEAELSALGAPMPERVTNGEPLRLPPGLSNETILRLYERNAILNEIQQRRVGYSLQATRATAPGSFTTVVQRRSLARIVPPPPSPVIPLLEMLGVGLLLALSIPVLLDRFDSTITEARVAPGALRARLLATIPHMPKRVQDGYAPPGSTWDAAFRSLAATSLSTDQLPRAIMVTGPVGSTQDTVAANFAVGLASLGVTVALVGTVPRQKWFHHNGVELGDGDGDGDGDDAEGYVYLDVDAAAAAGSETAGEPSPTAPAGAPGQHPPGEVDVSAATEPLTTIAPAAPDTPEPPAEAPAEAVAVPTFPELLELAQSGQLTGDLRARLATGDVTNLYVVPPGSEGAEISLDGLPPLLDVLARNDIDVTVLAGPALLEDPNATIMAWSTRHVLWALEIGRVNLRDAQLAADRLELAGVAPFGLALLKRQT